MTSKSNPTMSGAAIVLQAAASRGVSVCFANPGTTEMPLVGALDSVPGMRAVLGLFEGVCTGAADGYGRMTGRAACTLLHLGRDSPTAWPICTTRGELARPSSISLVTTPAGICSTTRR